MLLFHNGFMCLKLHNFVEKSRLLMTTVLWLTLSFYITNYAAYF